MEFTPAMTRKRQLCLVLTFSDAEGVVATSNKVVEGNKEIGVILAGTGQEVLLGVPAGRFSQTLGLKVWSLQSF